MGTIVNTMPFSRHRFTSSGIVDDGVAMIDPVDLQLIDDGRHSSLFPDGVTGNITRARHAALGRPLNRELLWKR